MRVHHILCGTLCPVGFGLLGVQPKPHGMVCHCLVIETNDGLVLVDTGFGTDDLRDPVERLGGPFTRLVRPTFDPKQTAVAQIERLGFKRSDVRHIIPTHLDLDHAGGLPDFPEATVHVFRKELDAALARATYPERQRYRPVHFAHQPKWDPCDVRGEAWFGFECVRQLEGLPPEILLVPTIGHSRGHCAIAVETNGTTLLHAGDAYFHRDEMDPEQPKCPLPLKLFQSAVAIDDLTRIRNRERLRMLAREQEHVRVFCAHDPIEAERCGAS